MSALNDRDTNLQPTSHPAITEKQNATGEENKPQDSQQHKQLLENITQNSGKPGQNYISPSDAILSPASKKLADFKQKQISKQGGKTPAARTLFARNASSCSSGFDDIETTGEKS